VRPSLLGLLAGTALLYTWALGASGWANSYYAAAVQAGTESWKAFFYGSFDSSNYITRKRGRGRAEARPASRPSSVGCALA